MWKLQWKILFGCAVCVFATSCSSEAPSTDNRPGETDEFRDFLSNAARAYCERLFRCQEAHDEVLRSKLLLGSVARCEALFAQGNVRSAGLRDLEAKLAAGKVRYVSAASADCLADLGSCQGADWIDGAKCRAVFSGRVQPGGACERSEDCAGDAFCEFLTACPGRCQLRKTSGSACLTSDECSHQGQLTLCDHEATSGPACASLALGTPAAVGEACTLGDGSGATQFVPCGEGSWCDAVGGSSSPALGECREPISEGGACASNHDVCEDGLFCVTARAACVAVTIRRAAGEACDEAALVACDASLGLVCVDGQCRGGVDGANGAACYRGDYQLGCGVGLYCELPPAAASAAAGSCVPLLPKGSPCTANAACASGTCSVTCAERFCEH